MNLAQIHNKAIEVLEREKKNARDNQIVLFYGNWNEVKVIESFWCVSTAGESHVRVQISGADNERWGHWLVALIYEEIEDCPLVEIEWIN